MNSELRGFKELAEGKVANNMNQYADVTYDEKGFPVIEKLTLDVNTVQMEVEIQRKKWDSFIKSRGGIKPFEEEWLWQYWRPESRQTNKIKKTLFGMFDSRLSTQKKLKKLIRGGVPSELRSEIWWATSGAPQKLKNANTGTYSHVNPSIKMVLTPN